MNCNPCSEHPLDQPTRRLNSNQILESVCNFYSMSPSLVCGKLRFKNIVEARMVAAYVLRKDRYLSLGLKHIGNILGGKDHTSVMHHVKRIGELIDIEPEFRVKIKEVFLETYGSATYFYE